jgi:hypothetical protein
MITAHNSNTNGPGWVQTGYGNFAAPREETGAWSWGQSNKGCNATLTSCQSLNDWWGDELNGTTPTWTYVSRYYTSDGKAHMLVNGTEIGQTKWSPTANWDGSWQGQFYGETHMRQSDVSGTPGDHTSFTNNDRLTYVSGNPTWNNITGLNQLGPDICRWDAEWITQGSSFRIRTSHPNSDC